jgi:sterol desaturase/sphingolipid hydroxylase (fatty acid hydroxylase superfamily)
MSYFAWLMVLSAAFLVLERLRPARASQPLWRPGLVRDAVFLVVNGHWLGVALALVSGPLQQRVQAWASTVTLGETTLREVLWANVAQPWPVWLQFGVAFVVIDFMQWCVHNLLHRVPWLWEFHKVHHGIQHMDWIGSMRFHWAEAVIYKSLQYLPMVWLGFRGDVLLVVWVLGTAIGHWNHANLKVDIGWLGYVLNSPRMHLWHHAHDAVQARPVNFGINLAVWDWLFGTAYLPPEPPARLGFTAIESFPQTFVGEELYPLPVETGIRRWWRGRAAE